MRIFKIDGVMPIAPRHLALFDGLDVEFIDTPCLTEDAIVDHCADADALLILREPVTERVTAALQRCRIYSRFGIGLDTIDVPAATAAGIAVANVPDSNIEEVSTHALAMMLSLTRRLPAFDQATTAGRWEVLSIGRGMMRPQHMVLGLIGFGQIGRLTARKAAAFGFRILVHDPMVNDEAIADLGFEPAGYDELIEAADIVSLHIPLTPATDGLIGRAALERMKHGAILINVSRGGLVDEAALAEALRAGRIGGAGIDTFAQEPLAAGSPLLSAPNAVLTPHVAHYSDQSLDECITKAFVNVAEVLRGKRAPYQVNEV